MGSPAEGFLLGSCFGGALVVTFSNSQQWPTFLNAAKTERRRPHSDSKRQVADLARFPRWVVMFQLLSRCQVKGLEGSGLLCSPLRRNIT